MISKNLFFKLLREHKTEDLADCPDVPGFLFRFSGGSGFDVRRFSGHGAADSAGRPLSRAFDGRDVQKYGEPGAD